MVLYPNGEKKEDGNHYISLFLAIAEPDNVSLRWEVNVTAKLLVFDAIRDRYLVVYDADRLDWRFHRLKMEWGFVEFLLHDELQDPSNGFLVDDHCIFGVEVCVLESSGEGESISFVEEPSTGLYTWKIDNFSALDKSCCCSEVFSVEGINWKLMLYPKGDSEASGTHLSIFLSLDESETLPAGRKLYASYSFRIKDQKNRNHFEDEGYDNWFDEPGSWWGESEFMQLSALKDPSNGYLVKDCMIIEAKFDLVSVVEDFS